MVGVNDSFPFGTFAEAAELKSAGIAIVVPWAGGEAEKMLGTIPPKGMFWIHLGDDKTHVFFSMCFICLGKDVESMPIRIRSSYITMHIKIDS